MVYRNWGELINKTSHPYLIKENTQLKAITEEYIRTARLLFLLS